MSGTRKTWSVNQKIAMVEQLEAQLQDPSNTLRSVSRDLGVDPSQLRRWRLQSTQMKEFQGQENRRTNNQAKTIHRGRNSHLLPLEESLLQYVFETREQGHNVSVRMVMNEACKLDATFRRKASHTRDMAIRRFLFSHNLCLRVRTHESQKSMQEMSAVALDWLKQSRNLCLGPRRHQAFIINMDQTPIFFSMVPRTTIEKRGTKSVNVLASTSSTMRVTVALTVTADGTTLPPMFIFKGKPGGRIEKREFPNYPQEGLYSV